MKRKKPVTFSLSDQMIQAIELFSEQFNLSKSVIVNLALCKYLKSKDEFLNNPKAKELLDYFTTID